MKKLFIIALLLIASITEAYYFSGCASISEPFVSRADDWSIEDICLPVAEFIKQEYDKHGDPAFRCVFISGPSKYTKNVRHVQAALIPVGHKFVSYIPLKQKDWDVLIPLEFDGFRITRGNWYYWFTPTYLLKR